MCSEPPRARKEREAKPRLGCAGRVASKKGKCSSRSAWHGSFPEKLKQLGLGRRRGRSSSSRIGQPHNYTSSGRQAHLTRWLPFGEGPMWFLPPGLKACWPETTAGPTTCMGILHWLIRHRTPKIPAELDFKTEADSSAGLCCFVSLVRLGLLLRRSNTQLQGAALPTKLRVIYQASVCRT